jgi:GT2 family glycosyltransferase
VIVCVHNALDDVKACLQSLRHCWNSDELSNLIVVDDCSDSETAAFLQEFCDSFEFAKLVRPAARSFYTKSANLGLKASAANLRTLLNSDTVVTKNWAASIRGVFERMPFVGIVGPLSNAASTQSLPLIESGGGQTAINSLPKDVSVDDFAEIVSELARGVPTPLVPLVHGFCYTVHENVIQKIGYFAEDAFPNGYGEENDYSFRAEDAGYALAIALDCFIFHSKSKSYSDEMRRQFIQRGEKQFVARHGQRRRDRAIAYMKNNPSLVEMRTRVLMKWPRHSWY